MSRWLVVLGLLAGCHKLLDLEHVDDPARDDSGGLDDSLEGDAAKSCVPVGFDEDADGYDDACDRCPTVNSTVATADLDSDGDGLPDDCDPSDMTQDEILRFWSFANPADMSSLTITGGVYDNTGHAALLLGATGSLLTKVRYVPSRIEVRVSGGSATAATGKLTVGLPGIVACEILAKACTTTGSSACATVVPSPNTGATLAAGIAGLREVVFHDSSGARCTIASSGASVTAVGVAGFSSSTLEISTNAALAIHIESIVIYGIK
jgi:hypothetical protein